MNFHTGLSNSLCMGQNSCLWFATIHVHNNVAKSSLFIYILVVSVNQIYTVYYIENILHSKCWCTVERDLTRSNV